LCNKADPSASDSGSLRKEGDQAEATAVGIVHVLKETEPARAAYRGAKVLFDSFRKRTERANLEPLFARAKESRKAENDGFEGWAARRFAEYAVGKGIRPLELPSIIALANEKVRRSVARARVTGVAEIDFPEIYAVPDGSLEERMAFAAILSDAIADRAVVDLFAEKLDQPLMARQQLRMRGLQGGELLNYWCNDPDLNEECPEGLERGGLAPASELFGTGLTIRNISEEKLRAWIADGREIAVRVEHKAAPPAARPEASMNSISPGYVGVDTVQTRKWKGTFWSPRLRPTHELQRALSEGTSNAPPPPSKAEINYDLSQSNAGVPNAEDPNEPSAADIQTPTFETGEGKVQILIGKPSVPDWYDPDHHTGGSRTVYSYNIYGIYEGAPGASKFFKKKPDVAKLEELRPWRITSRYSYSRDLKNAFPPTGAAHPVISRLLADPPWFPVMERPDVTIDRTPTEVTPGAKPAKSMPGQKLPIVGRNNMTAYSLDLRKGMGVRGQNGETVFWDTEGPMEWDWSVDLDRDLNDAGTQPQRWIFWVTSVDPFEQESEPVPVRANDVDAGEEESFFFFPRWRTPLAPPPQSVPEAVPANEDGETPDYKNPGKLGTESLFLRVSDDDLNPVLKLQWETPFREELGALKKDFSAPVERVTPASQLTPKVLIYRKRIRKPLEKELEPDFVRSLKYDDPQWRAFGKSLEDRGFTFFREVEQNAILIPEDEKDPEAVAWSASVPLEWKDRGFEYVAGIAMRVGVDRTAFWHSSIEAKEGVNAGRTVWVWEYIDGEPVQKPTRISEYPSHSDIAETNLCAVVNKTPPRPPQPAPESTMSDNNWHRAEPVKPVRHVQRDEVLLKLLTHPVEGEDDPTAWRDTGVILSSAQKLMCDRALQRCADGIGVKPGVERLATARRLMAEEIGAGRVDRPLAATLKTREGVEDKVPRVLLQHSTVGFRGILTLSWTYSPFLAVDPQPGKEAEASLFRVYQVRVPSDYSRAKPYATFFVKARKAGDLAYEFEKRISSDVFKAIAKSGQPAVALVCVRNEVIGIHSVAKITEREKQPPVLTLTEATEHLPERAEILVIGAHPIAEVPVRDYGDESDQPYSVDLPVGGGEREEFFWWVKSVSAQGRESNTDTALVTRRFFPTTIEPQPPLGFRALPPWNREAHMADANDPKVKPFIPSTMHDEPTLARNNPRLLVTWKKAPQGSLIELSRRRRRIGQANGGEGLMRSDARAMSDYQAIKKIENTSSGESLDAEAVRQIGKVWLLGGSVRPDDEIHTAAEDPGDILIKASDGLSGVEGPGLIEYVDRIQVEKVDGLEALEKQPAFVDYFLKAGNKNLAMEGSFLYAYQARQVIDLDPDRSLGLDEEDRYLRSRSTVWTTFQEPGTTQFEVLEGVTQRIGIEPHLPPRVEFRFSVANGRGKGLNALSGEQIRNWTYQITLQRRIERGVSPGSGADFENEWIDVGQPVDIQGDQMDASIIDDGLERASPVARVDVTYRIKVVQFATLERVEATEVGTENTGDERPEERLIRRNSANEGFVQEIAIGLDAMQTRLDEDGLVVLLEERHVVKYISIR